MSFFKDENGKALTATKSYDSNISFEPIPDGTQVKSIVSGIKWISGDYNYISLELLVIEGQYKGRLIKSKIQYADSKPEKAAKALKLLLTLDSIGKGALEIADQNGVNIIGNDAVLAKSIQGIKLIVTLGVYDFTAEDTGKRITGNWIMGVQPVFVNDPVKQQEQIRDYSSTGEETDFSDDIPF